MLTLGIAAGSLLLPENGEVHMCKCKGCIWGTWLTQKKVLCMFPVCFKEKYKLVKLDAEKA